MIFEVSGCRTKALPNAVLWNSVFSNELGNRLAAKVLLV